MSSLWIELHDFSVLWMTAVIWLVQILIYPAFKQVSEAEFVAFHKKHCDRISPIVGPMILQPFALLLVLMSSPITPEWIIHSGCIALIYAATAFLSVPDHHLLGKGKNADAIDHLIKGNWVRTVLWTVQLTLILYRRLRNF